jgi:hypothetical protein
MLSIGVIVLMVKAALFRDMVGSAKNLQKKLLYDVP